jgi:saccharopine dehydrogenase (NAD+, L-lysine-forming)
VTEAAVLVLGGYGETGRRVARLLADRARVRIVIAGRSAARAASLAAVLASGSGADRVTGIALDAADPAALRRALEGTALIVNATTTSSVSGAAVAGAALGAGADVVDLQFPVWDATAPPSLAARAIADGRCVVTQAGFHPGVPTALIRWAGRRIELERAWVGGLLRQRGGLPYTPAVDDLIESFRTYRASAYDNGRWTDVPWWSPRAMSRVWFDFGFGRQWTAIMDLDEIRPLPQLFPSLRDVGFSVSGFDPVTDMVMSLLIFAALPLWGGRPVTPLAKALCWSTRTFSRAPFGVVVQLEADGRTRSGPARLRLGLYHEDGYDLTAIPAVSLVEQILDGTVREPGLHPMGLVVDPDRMLADCLAMGVRVRTLGRGAVEGLVRPPPRGARPRRSRPS